MAIPKGWEIAKKRNSVIKYVIAKNPWQTHGMCFVDGSCYYTSSDPEAGSLDRESGFLEYDNNGRVRPSACYEHILLKKMDDDDDMRKSNWLPGYTQWSPDCDRAQELQVIHNMDVTECAALCDAATDPPCDGFEYGVNHGGSKTNWEPRDCILILDVASDADCGDYNLDYYHKEKIEALVMAIQDMPRPVQIGAIGLAFVGAVSIIVTLFQKLFTVKTDYTVIEEEEAEL